MSDKELAEELGYEYYEAPGLRVFWKEQKMKPHENATDSASPSDRIRWAIEHLSMAERKLIETEKRAMENEAASNTVLMPYQLAFKAFDSNTLHVLRASTGESVGSFAGPGIVLSRLRYFLTDFIEACCASGTVPNPECVIAAGRTIMDAIHLERGNVA